MKRILKIILLLLAIRLYSGFVEKAYLPIGSFGYINMYKFKIDDFNRNGFDELIYFDYVQSKSKSIIYFYEYGDGFNFTNIKQFERELCVLYGTGDLDSDGNRELFGADSNTIWLMEQKDSLTLPDSITWESDTTWIHYYYIGITNKLKGDEVDRIYGAGIPWLSSSTKGYGWYYFTCTGDNQYEILNTFGEDDWIQSAMDIGDIDGEGLTDVVITSPENYLYFYESEDLTDTNFIKQDSLTEGGYGSGALLILPDIDRDGIKEVMKYQVNYIGYPTSYGYLIYEDTSGTGVYDTIWRRDFEVETDYMLNYGGDIDYGDVDGDSMNELVICGGRHIEVWESTGDNQFERMWEWTDPTYYTIQSHIKCHDFNKNGVDEIIFSGAGQTGECTRIFEMKRWSMERETLVIGNSDDGDTIRKDLVIRNESDGELNIDSMIINSTYFGITSMIWPLTINGNDSTSIEVWFKGDSMGRYIDSMEVYADKSMTMEYIRAGNKMELIVDSIKAFDGINPISGIDEDDIVVFFFGWGTNKPDINENNIDSILRLSGGDEWDISGEGIELTKWLSYPDGDRFYVYFDASGKIPTVRVGDTVYTDSQTVIGSWCGEVWKRPVVLTGSFGPTGTGECHEPCAVGCEPKIQMQSQYIIWNTNTEGRLTVYDISGRELIREESKASGTHKTDIRHLKNGIYFIKLKDDNQSITKKMVKIR